MKKQSLVFAVLAVMTTSAWGNSEVQRLLDGYVVAKAETLPVGDEQVKDSPYTIQVASYINEKDAASHVDELKVQEKDAFYFPAFVRGQVWFKVCAGRFATQEAAEKYRKDFAKRMDEPITFVISLLDRPTQGRGVASVVEREVMPIPQMEGAKEESKGPVVEVKLLPKAAKIVPTSKPFGTVDEKTAEVAKPLEMAKPATGEHYYAVQIGAFPTEALAKDRLTKVDATGTETFVKEAVVDGKTWYRAYVGNFGSHQEAKVFHGEFVKKNAGDSFVRRIHK